jgi:transcription elongation factor GreA
MHTTPERISSPRPFPGGVVLSRADLTAALAELEALRGAHRADFAARLRDARGHGSGRSGDEHLAVLEDAAVVQSKIARLEHLIATATVVDGDEARDGAARLGSVVRVRDHRGRETEYELVGRRSERAERPQVTPASPVGEALLGARAGDVVGVVLPNGAQRTLTVLAVEQAR